MLTGAMYSLVPHMVMLPYDPTASHRIASHRIASHRIADHRIREEKRRDGKKKKERERGSNEDAVEPNEAFNDSNLLPWAPAVTSDFPCHAEISYFTNPLVIEQNI